MNVGELKKRLANISDDHVILIPGRHTQHESNNVKIGFCSEINRYKQTYFSEDEDENKNIKAVFIYSDAD